MAIDHVSIGGVAHCLDAKTIEGQIPEAAVTAVTGSKKKIRVTTPLFSSLPVTFSVNGMTANHKLSPPGYILLVDSSGNPKNEAKGSEWSSTTAAGQLSLDGTFAGSTAVRMIAEYEIQTDVTAANS